MRLARRPLPGAGRRRRAPAVNLRRSQFALPALVAVTLLAVARAFAPGMQAVGPFDSDQAIPVLMANTPRLTGYELFYWGQDRLGAWPFLVVSLVSRAGGVVTAGKMFAANVVALAVLVLAFSRLAGKAAPLMAAALLALAILDVRAMHMLWSAAQPYAWQLAALGGAWLAARRVLRAASLWNLLAFGLLAWLGIWMSPLTLGLLAIAAGVEVALTRGARFTPGLRLGAMLGLAALADAGVHAIHRRAAHAQGLWFQTTQQELDLAHLPGNAAHVLEALTRSAAGAVLLLALGLGALAVIRRRGEAELRALGLGATGCAAATLALLAFTSWMRLNDYDPRYLVPALVLGAVGAAALLASFVPALLRHAWLLALATLLLATWRAPRAVVAPEELSRQAAADALAARAPMVLFGSYWELYVLAGLRPDAPIVCANIEREFDRMGFTRPQLRAAPEVVVGLAGTSRFGTAASPVPFISEDQILLQRLDARWLEAGGRTFARYRARTAQRLPVNMEEQARAAVDGRNDTLWLAEPLAHAGGAITARVQAPARAQVVLFVGDFDDHAPLPALQLQALDARGAACGPPVAMAGAVNVLVGNLEGCASVEGLRIEALREQPPPRIRELVVLPPE